jgi:hypothetical protein
MIILKSILMKKVKVKFIHLAVAWGFSNHRGDVVELEATDKLAEAIAIGRIELIGEAPADFKKKVVEKQEHYKQSLIKNRT